MRKIKTLAWSFAPIMTLILSLLGIIHLQKQSLADAQKLSTDNYAEATKEEQVFLNTQERLPTLGFGNILADWTYLRFIQYFGDTAARDKTGYGLVSKFFQLIAEDDPRFLQAFLMLSGANTMYALNPQKTVKLMDQVLKKITPQLSPLAPYIWSYKGVDEMLFLGDNQAAQYSYEMAAKWAEERGDKAVAKRNQETADFLAKNPDSKKARVAAWMSIMENALDDRVRRQAIQEIRSLGGKVETNLAGQLKITFPEQD